MSSTNRTNAKDRHISDYYVTPVYAVDLFFREFFKKETIYKDAVILDPCSGGDENNKMSYPEVLKKYFKRIITIDIRKNSLAKYKRDYLKVDIQFEPDIIVTNPPFNLSMEIIEKAINDVDEKGWVIMLLRLNFLGSSKRKNFFNLHKPKYIFVHSKRMSFKPDGSTDSIEYAHFVWNKVSAKNTELILI